MAIAVPPRAATSIILRGHFNPSIFQPAWFAKLGLISDGEAEAANISLIHPQVAAFETTSFRIQVTEDTFEATSAGKPIEEPIRDLAHGTFSVLRHTPLTAVGVNRWEHFDARSEEKYHEMGNILAPKAFWSFMKSPGTQSLVIRGEREDDYPGYLDVRFEPSALIRPTGIFVLVNDHIQSLTPEAAQSADYVLDAIQGTWGAGAERARTVLANMKEFAGV